jgi:hypothetical protein
MQSPGNRQNTTVEYLHGTENVNPVIKFDAINVTPTISGLNSSR